MSEPAKRKRGRPPNPVPVPPALNGDRAAWENATARKMEEIIGKLMAKLEQKMDSIKAEKIPLAVAILTDKAALLSGRPTSMSATLTLKGNFNAEEIKARLTGKAPKTVKATVTDAKPAQLGVGTQSVYTPTKGRQHLPSAQATDDPPAPYAGEPITDIQSTVSDTQTIDSQPQ